MYGGTGEGQVGGQGGKGQVVRQVAEIRRWVGQVGGTGGDRWETGGGQVEGQVEGQGTGRRHGGVRGQVE